MLFVKQSILFAFVCKIIRIFAILSNNVDFNIIIITKYINKVGI
jgi:hypothetical protein